MCDVVKDYRTGGGVMMMLIRPLPPPHWQAVGHHQLGATGSVLSTLSSYSQFYQMQENLIRCPLLGFECT